MKKMILAAMLSAVALSTTLIFAQPVPPGDTGTPARPAMPNVQKFDEQMVQVQENLKKMQEQMDKVRQIQAPPERQKLLQEHWATLQNTMQLMRGLWRSSGGWGGGMGGPGMGPDRMMGSSTMGWKQMGDYYSALTPEQLRHRQYMMDQYMTIQMMIMDQMLQQQQYGWTSPR